MVILVVMEILSLSTTFGNDVRDFVERMDIHNAFAE
jgi:hypothetical protein